MYLPIAAGVLHCLCRVEQRQDLVFSDRELTDVRFQTEANMDLTQQISHGMAPACRAARTASLVGTEMASYILWILSAGQGNGALDRSVSSLKLLKDNEMEGFHHHADILHSLGLSYQSDTTDDAFTLTKNKEFRLRLEPPIYRFAMFKEGQKSRRRPIPDTVRLEFSPRTCISIVSCQLINFL